MDPGAWDHGTANLSLEEEAAYLRIVNAIHKNKSPVPNNVRVWAGLFRCSTRKAKALLDALVAAGKVQITDAGVVNERAISDLVHRGFVSVSRAESGAKGGRTRAENARKALKDKDTTQANASTREEKSRVETEDTGVSSVTRKRATRIPKNWVLPKSLGQWAVEQGVPEATVRFEADRFKDYWTSKSGKDASKLDWDATWRNWIRKWMDDNKQLSRAARPQQRSGPHSTLYAGFGAYAAEDDGRSPERPEGMRDVTPPGGESMAYGQGGNSSQPFLRLAHGGG